jgi:hypothetical protein
MHSTRSICEPLWRAALPGVVAAALACQAHAQPAAAPQAPAPVIQEGVTTKVSPHTYVIPDRNVGLVPNVGIVVGGKATLVIDTARGDTIFFVEEDRVLFSGDVAMPALPALISPSSSVRAWLDALAAMSALGADRVVPSHGAIGDSRLIDDYRRYFEELQRRAGALKSQGLSQDEGRQSHCEGSAAIARGAAARADRGSRRASPTRRPRKSA